MNDVIREACVEKLCGHARMHVDQSSMEELCVIELMLYDVCLIPTSFGGLKDEGMPVHAGGMDIAP